MVAQTDIAPEGMVMLQGELWEAVSDEVIKQGEAAVVKAVEGLKLRIKRVK